MYIYSLLYIDTMKRTKIFPDSVINQSAEKLFYENSQISHLIYITVLAMLIIAFVLLFYIRVDIGIKSVGVIKPKGERTLIKTPSSGRVIFVTLVENQSVKIGDTLFIIQSEILPPQSALFLAKKQELNETIHDLKQLTGDQCIENCSLQSREYQQERILYLTQLKELVMKEKISAKNLERNRPIYDKGMLAKIEFEKLESDYDNIKVAKELLAAKQYGQWLSDLNKYESDLNDINLRITQLDIQSNETIIRSPISGTIQKIDNISNGTHVFTGQQILELSPDGDLMLECYIAPKDRGLLRVGQLGRIQIDAFNYNEWGILSGRVEDIFDDIIMTEQNMFKYKVYCSLDSLTLKLRNGYVGHVKKGMTANVRFVVANRTLFQLLYDKVDKWLNPNIIK